MKRDTKHGLFALALLCSAGMVSTHAAAQWMWKDANGRMVISDQAPPPAVPYKNIVRAPKEARTGSAPPLGIAASPTSPAINPSGNPAPPSFPSSDSTPNDKKVDAPKTYAEKDLEFRKRQKEAADTAKKQEDEAEQAKSRKERCDTLRGNLAGLESGVRIARVNDKGEREYLDDAQRQAEIEKTRKASTGC